MTPLPTAIAHLGIPAFLDTGRRAPPRMGARPATGCRAGNWSAAAASASPSLATRAPGKGRLAGPACEPESPSNSRLNPKSAPVVGRELPAGEDSDKGGDGLSGASVGAGALAGMSGDSLGAGAPVGASGVTVGTPGGRRADAGIGGGAAPLRPATCPAVPAIFGAIAAGGELGSPAGARVGGAAADPPRSNDNPDGGGPDVDSGEGDESKSKLSGGPPPVARGCCANDKSSANPSGGVLLEPLSEPGSHPGRVQPLDWGRSSGRGAASRDTGKSPGRGIVSRGAGRSVGRGTASRDTGKSPGRGIVSRGAGRSVGRGTASRDAGRLSALAGGLTLKTVWQ
jgi:hypothetical protein